MPYAAQRMVNLMGAWHSQLLEVLGAMGLREARRLRGEAPRICCRGAIKRRQVRAIKRRIMRWTRCQATRPV